jgi:hypothetical protein
MFDEVGPLVYRRDKSEISDELPPVTGRVMGPCRAFSGGGGPEVGPGTTGCGQR